MLAFTFLDHSGFLVETDRFYLIFDYSTIEPETGSRAQGVICPGELSDKQVIVFCSHRHSDHFNPVILVWSAVVPNIEYIFSDDIVLPAKAVYIGPDQCCSVCGVSVRTFCSTDEGVAFLVEADGYRIYHAGDLNWWHWEGEDDAYNQNMAQRYQWEIAKMAGEVIDLAFVPVDLRLGKKAYVLGIDYFMRSVSAKKVVPMHFWHDFSVCSLLRQEERAVSYRDRIIFPERRGQTVLVSE